MMHGPCGDANPTSPCMQENLCTKRFPKKFYSQTTVDDDGFPIYRRRDDGRFVERNGIKLDNRFVVPHNLNLVVEYQAHINIEWCNKGRSIKYLFKYVNKGPDRARVCIEHSRNDCDEIDEIKTFLDCRFLSPPEACWRIFEFDIHSRDPAVERLVFHLPNEHNVVFHDSNDLRSVYNRPNIEKTMFTE